MLNYIKLKYLILKYHPSIFRLNVSDWPLVTRIIDNLFQNGAFPTIVHAWQACRPMRAPARPEKWNTPKIRHISEFQESRNQGRSRNFPIISHNPHYFHYFHITNQHAALEMHYYFERYIHGLKLPHGVLCAQYIHWKWCYMVSNTVLILALQLLSMNQSSHFLIKPRHT